MGTVSGRSKILMTLLWAPLAAAAGGHLGCASPVGYWPMDAEADDQAVDVTNRGQHLALTDVARVEGAVGAGLQFNGKTSHARTALTEALRPVDAITVEVWVRLDAVPKTYRAIGLVAASDSYQLHISPTSGPTPTFRVFTDRWHAARADDWTLAVGQWYHLAGTYDGRFVRLYVNGRLMQARPARGAIRQADGSLVLARQADHLHGCLDEVAIHARALPAAEIAGRFAAIRGRLNSGAKLGTVVEPHHALFGATRDRPAPPATLGHLPRADVTFAVIADTHVGLTGQEAPDCHNWRVREAVRQINALNVDFVVHCGDVVSAFPYSPAYEPQCRHARAVLGGLHRPVYFTPGNHDVGYQRNLRVWEKSFFDRHAGLDLEAMLFKPSFRAMYRKYFGEDYYSFQAGGCTFLVLNGQILNSGGPLEDAQMNWLEAELDKSRAAKAHATFLFTHQPLFWSSPHEPGPKNHEPVLEPARSKVLALLRKYAVTAVYSGHTHFGFANDYHGTRMRTVGSTTYNRSHAGIDPGMPPGPAAYDPYPLGFLIVRVRGGEVHESWVPLYWRVGDPPAALASRYGPRLVGRPAGEMADSVLGIAAPPPTGRPEVVNDRWWRLGEEIGSKWLQVRLDARGGEERALTLGRPRGVHLALPLPASPDAMRQAWLRLKPHAQAVAAVIVPNGKPAKPAKPLGAWTTHGDVDDWIARCRAARKLVGDKTKLVLARLPLQGDGAVDRIRRTALAAKGAADVLAVWITPHDQPENLAEALVRAAKAVRANGMSLWVDAAGWPQTPPPLRTTYFLRLLALCHVLNVRVFWWPGPADPGGLLDSRWDPTPLYYAAQSWQTMTAGPAVAGSVHPVRQGTILRWQDAAGGDHMAWWGRSDQTPANPPWMNLTLPPGAIVADPLHGRLMRLPPGKVPVLSWPLIASQPHSR